MSILNKRTVIGPLFMHVNHQICKCIDTIIEWGALDPSTRMANIQLVIQALDTLNAQNNSQNWNSFKNQLHPMTWFAYKKTETADKTAAEIEYLIDNLKQSRVLAFSYLLHHEETRERLQRFLNTYQNNSITQYIKKAFNLPGNPQESIFDAMEKRYHEEWAADAARGLLSLGKGSR